MGSFRFLSLNRPQLSHHSQPRAGRNRRVEVQGLGSRRPCLARPGSNLLLFPFDPSQRRLILPTLLDAILLGVGTGTTPLRSHLLDQGNDRDASQLVGGHDQRYRRSKHPLHLSASSGIGASRLLPTSRSPRTSRRRRRDLYVPQREGGARGNHLDEQRRSEEREGRGREGRESCLVGGEEGSG